MTGALVCVTLSMHYPEHCLTGARIPTNHIYLHVHEYFVKGFNGSFWMDKDLILIDIEKQVHVNDRSTCGFEVDDITNLTLDNAPGIMSCSNIQAVVALISVELAGGPCRSLPLGRRDGTTTNIESANNLPSPFDSPEMLQEKFKNLGLDDTDHVALHGENTFGRVQCQLMQQNCSVGEDEETLVNLDTVIPNVFDNKYYGSLLCGCTPLPLTRFSISLKDSLKNYAASMVKMGTEAR
ncbi:hypothetical protein CFC21_043377 [Triticum aestivum]|uniref:Plant heme peroxidase family profile domain-containing protein n=2 Tax=Triticum aestivum TaxID=4565 RepID=A0A9R1FPB7_WHEAT|nr:hypothetical protein CFC21_043377 [Triticum aestivum]CDM85524.1 unnamed protein product [Triticum aestivum]